MQNIFTSLSRDIQVRKSRGKLWKKRSDKMADENPQTSRGE